LHVLPWAITDSDKHDGQRVGAEMKSSFRSLIFTVQRLGVVTGVHCMYWASVTLPWQWSPLFSSPVGSDHCRLCQHS
jgi:hypothetical protein